MATHSSIIAWSTSQTVRKGGKMWHWKISPPGWKVSNMLLGKSGGQLLIALERKKWLGQSRNGSVVDVSSGESKVWCCTEQYCIGIWNARSINQGKLDVVKQEMTRLNINILGISELKWTQMTKLNSDDHFICYYCQESLRRNGVALIIKKKSPRCSIWVQSQKMTEWFQFISKTNYSTSQ